MVDAANGQVDFLFGSPTINWLMVNQFGPFKSFTEGPELEKKVGMIFSYQIGPYHYITRADSGITSLHDLRGKKIFSGPPGGAGRLHPGAARYYKEAGWEIPEPTVFLPK
jgi:hypothetical protein